jgi:glycosyltransferase involved in cell wall biosynthesis
MPKMFRRIPMVATLHGWTWNGGMNRMMAYEWLDSLSLARMDSVVLVNGAMKEHARLRNRKGLAVEVIPNGIPADAVPEECTKLNREIVDFCRQGYTIGAVGRLSPEKGFDLLLEAVAGLIAEGKDVRLAFLGEGGLRGQLEERAGELGLEGRILMPGYVRNARDYLHLFGVFAMPSLTEGLPIVLLEAMQAGAPIVASRVGAIPDVLAEGRAGLLIEPGSAESLKQAISEVMRDPAAAKQRMREAGERVRERYSSRAMTEKYLEIYRRVIK